MGKNYYQILEIDRKASSDDVKRAYRKLAKRYHPDYNANDKSAEEKFLEIALAYETLSNPLLRSVYDKTIGGTASSAHYSNIEHYLHVTISASIVKCCEEFELNFTYSGEGRYLKRPSLESFLIASKPYVDFSHVSVKGHLLKETCISYTLSAPSPGKYKIASATIKIENKTYQSVPVYIVVEPAQCFFTNAAAQADGKPLRLNLYHKTESGSKINRFIENRKHSVLIPRSRKANWLHNAGSGLKIIFTLWGIALSIKLSVNILAGALTGSLYGAGCCYALYYFNGVKSKYFMSHKYIVVADYIKKGYKTDESLVDGNRIQKVLSDIVRMLY